VRRNNRSRWWRCHRRDRRRHHRLRYDWCNHRPDACRRHGHRRLLRRSLRHRQCRWTRRCKRRRSSFLFLRDRSQHISWSGNMRQINFCLDFFFAATRARTRLASRRRPLRRGADVHTYFLRFVLFQRTGVRLLLGHPYQRKRIQNSFALDFQLSG